jgi:heat shock protein HslJ
MTTGVRFSEDYSDPQADIWIYSAAASPMPKAADYQGPNGYWEYLQQVQPEGQHGEKFHYRTINSDMLGWIVSRASGQSITELASRRLWRPMGAEQDAYMTVDGLGVPFAGGGLTAGLRDLARIGLLMLNGGVINGERLFPEAAVTAIRAGGDPTKFEGFPTIPGGSYASQWWLFNNANGAFAARGVHGQTIYVDPAADMVIVRFASFPQAQNGFIDPTSLPAYQAVADYLMSTPPERARRNSTMTNNAELTGEWRATHLAGEPVIANSRLEIRFADTGDVTGNASCNRFSGKFGADAGSVRIGDENGNLAATRMMCPPQVMAQEDRFFALLPSIDAFAVSSDGTLILSASGTEVLRAEKI